MRVWLILVSIAAAPLWQVQIVAILNISLAIVTILALNMIVKDHGNRVFAIA